MIQNKNVLMGYKLFFALLGFSAIITELAVLAERGLLLPANFFSYFTVQANVLAVIVLFLSALAVGRTNRRALDSLRGAATVYILLVGIGFSLLLADLKGAAFTAVAWDNIVLHYIMPVAVLIDLLIDRPKQKLAFRRCLIWLLFPIVYISYTLTRGALTGWYPYPFLNPEIKSYGAVVFIISSLLVLTLALIRGISALSGKKK